MNNDRFSGVLAPVITPFDAQLKVQRSRLADHCRWLLANNVNLAVFGTNSEANSLSVDEKKLLLDYLVDDGIAPHHLMPGTGCCALPDSINLTRHAVTIGCRGVLMLPPFYYKGVSDDGLFASYAQIIESVGDARLRIYLYHIPQLSGVPLSLELIERLLKHYPAIIAGIKDSSGDWNNANAMLDRQWDDFRVFCGSESLLLATMQQGGAGCISATANVNPAAIHQLYQNWSTPEASRLQDNLNTVREIFQAFPMIPALKAAVAKFRQEPHWLTVRPPLVSLDEAAQQSLAEHMETSGFSMPEGQ